MKNWICVIPTIREKQFQEFLTSFKPLFDKYLHTLIVMEDNPSKTFTIEQATTYNTLHFSWEDIDKELGDKSWIIPRRTDCIRSFGFLKAYQLNQPNILTLDDDVRYNNVDIFDQYNKGFNTQACNSNFFNTMEHSGTFPRGFPFSQRRASPVMLQWGMWENVPDLDGVTQLITPITNYKSPRQGIAIIQQGVGVTGCIMNCAFKREVTPGMYQLLMGKDRDGNGWPYDRWGDIWSGHLAKVYVESILKGCVAINYFATIRHDRASNVYTNIAKEVSGYQVNEEFWNNLNNGSDILFGPKEITQKYDEALFIWHQLM